MTAHLLTDHQVNNLVEKAVELAEAFGFGQLTAVSSESVGIDTHNRSKTNSNNDNPLSLPPYLTFDDPEWC